MKALTPLVVILALALLGNAVTLLRQAPAVNSIASINADASSGACNGYVGYCNRTISQVLWMGAHNALTDAGFALQRNQFVSGPALLDAGIRYLDIDTCAFVKQGQRMTPMICHGYEWYLAQVYQSTAAGLLPIRKWLEAHPREVIILNFGDVADFAAVNSRGIAASSSQLREELREVVRQVFGPVAIWRNEPWDAAVNANKATLGDLIAANRRVLVNIGISRSANPNAWGQSDRVCREAWYPDPLEWNDSRTDYNWTPVMDAVEATMRSPCATSPQLLNKLEFQFHNALSGTVDAASVGTVLNTYMTTLERRNSATSQPPYFPFNLILTDHADKWRSYHSDWHRRQLATPPGK